MKTKFTRAALGLAATAVVGAGAIGVNGLFIVNALAVNNDQKAPVITADAAAVNVEAETGLGSKYAATVVVDDNGNQTIVWDESLSAEDRARLEQDLEASGSTTDSSNSTFIAGTPSEHDLTEEQAVELAKNSVDSEFALTEETWARFSIDAKLNVVDPEAPVWSVTFYPADQNDFAQIGTYHVTIDSHSGDIIKLMSAADGVG